MKLFVDDERKAPSGWILAKTSADAIELLSLCRDGLRAITDLSLDHDLSIVDGEDDTTRPVVLWMCEHDWWPANVYVHTGNPVGEEWLVGMVQRYAPAGTLKGFGCNFWGTSNESVVRVTL